MNLHVVILAAGHGSRMKSDTAKVLQPLAGRPLLEHVVSTAEQLNPKKISVIYGDHINDIKKDLAYLKVNWVFQKKQLGTAHAVMQALPHCHDNEKVVVLFGDVPLISSKTLIKLSKKTPNNGIGIVTAHFKDPTGFGRIIHNEMGNIVAIVEEKDASLQERKIQEIYSGILTTSAKILKKLLPKIKSDNKQHEHYLTDIIALANQEGYPILGVLAECREEVQGVNDKWQLMQLERYYQRKEAKRLAQSGVTIMDANRLDIRGNVKIGRDVVLDVNVLLEGEVKIGTRSVIESNVILRDVEIGKGVHIKANTIIEGSKIGDKCEIGPYARIRPETTLSNQVKIGNFVEIKKSKVASKSKASHLAYLGDALIGEEVNIGAGTIICNYDGFNKHQTIIGKGAFIGSNTALVAPLQIGEKATIGAGSTIYKNVPPEKLTLTRARQTTIEKWKREKKRSSKKSN